MKPFYRKPRLGRSSVKEGFDNLPSGICFADHNGIVTLCNRQMHRLCHILMGHDLQQIFELRRALNEPQSNVKAIEKEQMIYLFPNGRFWKFAEDVVTCADGSSYTQVQAIDVTKLHEKRKELEMENRALAEANQRAKRLYAELDKIVRERETLAMKMRVHDELGQCLLASRNLLRQGGSLGEYRSGGKRWAHVLQMIALVNHSESAMQPAAVSLALSQLIASAAEIGVRVTVDGELPRTNNAYPLIVAMRECVTNTVRHASGSAMTVRILQTQREDVAVITNSGKPPQSKIIEGGGLSGLRRSIENKGGAMTIESSPVFRLTVSLPREEEHQ